MIGTLPLNLFSSDTAFASKFIKNLKNIITLVHVVQLNNEELNTISLWPKSTGDDDGLAFSSLQLSPGTVLILNETNIDSSKLNNTGLRNMNVLTKLIEEQRLEYEFPFHIVSLPTKLKIVSISRSKSIFSVTIFRHGHFIIC